MHLVVTWVCIVAHHFSPYITARRLASCLALRLASFTGAAATAQRMGLHCIAIESLAMPICQRGQSRDVAMSRSGGHRSGAGHHGARKIAAAPRALDCLIYQRAVRAVELAIDLALCGDVQPHHLASIITSGEREHTANLLGTVEVEGGRLHPSVVGNARVVHVPAVYLMAVPEEIVRKLLEASPLRRIGDLARLLCELPLHSHRHALARVDHTTRKRPLTRVLALDGNDLEHAGRRVMARDDGIRSMVWPPLA
mmetsp:Transcript_11957/g.30654  ORF Transcript_11957/g.30654 Transcript_11957/m.30654 type:complete len:254 (-) Transcript_11957:482-1243(-)